MSRSPRERGQNFDSLLDTMANVVGILVVVMAFTQIQIGEAVRRIHDTEVRGAFGFDEIRVQAGLGARREVARLEEVLRAHAPSDKATRAQLRDLDEPSSALLRSPGTAKRMQADVVEAILRETRLEHVAREELAQLRAQSTRLEVQLRGAKDDVANVSHQIRLPDPRPAPAGTDEIVFFARYGRVSLVDLERLNDRLNAGIRASANRDNSLGFTASLLVDHFERNEIGDRDFRWRLSDHAGVGVAARLSFRRETIGELRSELIVDDSKFRRVLARSDARTHYLLFYVWSDSFASYLRARDTAEKMGFAVGWRAFDRDAEHEGILRTNVLRNATPID